MARERDQAEDVGLELTTNLFVLPLLDRREIAVARVVYQHVDATEACLGIGDSLRQLALSGSHAAQIDRATQWIRANYAAPMAIDALAEATGMSVTSFHRHFKAMMLMTPVQYRARLRLQEARRLLLADARSVGAAAAMVGYDSQSQFTRDYKRMFGAPPGVDVARMAGAT